MDVLKFGRRAIGMVSLQKFVDGNHISRSRAIEAKCYDCQAGYTDGVADCEQSDCPLYEYHPYRGK